MLVTESFEFVEIRGKTPAAGDCTNLEGRGRGKTIESVRRPGSGSAKMSITKNRANDRSLARSKLQFRQIRTNHADDDSGQRERPEGEKEEKLERRRLAGIKKRGQTGTRAEELVDRRCRGANS